MRRCRMNDAQATRIDWFIRSLIGTISSEVLYQRVLIDFLNRNQELELEVGGGEERGAMGE